MLRWILVLGVGVLLAASPFAAGAPCLDGTPTPSSRVVLCALAEPGPLYLQATDGGLAHHQVYAWFLQNGVTTQAAVAAHSSSHAHGVGGEVAFYQASSSATQTNVDLWPFLPWVGPGSFGVAYYQQETGAGCMEHAEAYAFAGGSSMTHTLLSPRPCLLRAPALPPLSGP